jgi:hypothetical protein
LYLDKEFPRSLIHCNLADRVNSEDDVLSPFLYPEYDKIKHRLLKIIETQNYKNNDLFKSFIDGLIKNTSFKDHRRLKNFFNLNDQLDKSRNMFLKDYIPDLDKFR